MANTLKKLVLEKLVRVRPHLALFSLVVVVSCTSSNQVSGPINAGVIQSTGHCTYGLSSLQISTLNTLNPLGGKLGQVVRSLEVFDYEKNPTKFENFSGLFSLETFFTKRGDTVYPLDYPSLASLSLYAFMEQVYSLFINADPTVDLLAMVPDAADTKIVYQAKRYVEREKSEEFETDNASYYYIPLASGGSRNYLMVFPAGKAQVPLGLNPFVVAHEMGHFVSRYLWRKAFADPSRTELNTLGAIDEGFADYLGYLVTKDPAGFLCSFTDSAVRDLGDWKTIRSLKAGLTESAKSRLNLSDADFSIHYAGAVFAAVQFRIGNLPGIGHEEHFRSLVRTFKNLSTCTGGNLANFNSFATCHVRNMTRGQTEARQFYAAAFDGVEE